MLNIYVVALNQQIYDFFHNIICWVKFICWLNLFSVEEEIIDLFNNCIVNNYIIVMLL